MCEKAIKSFIAGMAFPAAFLSITYTVAYLMQFPPVLKYPLQFIPMWGPWIFGIANMILVLLDKQWPKMTSHAKYWCAGITLGLILATFGIVVIDLPNILFGWTGVEQLLPYLFLPVVYGLIFTYIIWPLNRMLGLRI